MDDRKRRPKHLVPGATDAWRRLPARLRLARLATGKSQQELADAAGASSNSWVAQVEAGTHTPSLEMLANLSRVLGVPAPWLLFGVGGDEQLAIAAGVGGRDLPVGDRRIFGDALIALYPNQWVRGHKGPRRGRVLIVSAELEANAPVVKRTRGELVAGAPAKAAPAPIATVVGSVVDDRDVAATDIPGPRGRRRTSRLR